ncbi:MAG TPA: alpha/beta fold hydrolase, partial [Sphingomicrobium sp.]|nr:alpha/beta fold hydrolase [Sphingomicrobium sp.]
DGRRVPLSAEGIPSNWKRLAELASLWPRMWRGIGHLGPRGPEGGPPALVVPGFIASDRTTMELRRALAEAGFRVHPWRHGWNLGATADVIDKLRRSLDLVDDDRPVLLVGWSLGGVFARELARAVPERVRAVVTLGSPFSGDPRLNNVWRLYERVAGHRVDDPPIPRITDKPPVPTLAIWSRRDGIVAAQAARGEEDERDKAVEVDSGHMAFGVSRRSTRAAVREIVKFLEERE